ncbi:hypothetical protein QR680_004504 [Steinernema hermaphroditum]|uniref:ShKT domain-containing protein n=1 Tax=Steinernema hermaphroditum TaxID=289476 RepID=A0AA39HQ09_9BILA|nr:hypothetical protein QR680_004504 [Steinernema hermaphroditum]
MSTRSMLRPVLFLFALLGASVAQSEPPCLPSGLCELEGQVCDLYSRTCVWEDDEEFGGGGGCAGGCPSGEGCSLSYNKCFKTCSMQSPNCPSGTSCAASRFLCLPHDYGNGDGVDGSAPLPRNGECEDLRVSGRVSDCPRKKYLCNNSLYYDLMTLQCPKTCGRCAEKSSGNRVTSKCVDFNVSECSQKRYLCKNSLYHEVMRTQCPMTCGFC